MKTKLKLSDIHVDQTIAIRMEIDEDTVRCYEDNLAQLPAITVFHVDSKYLLVDGFHRREAAVRKGWQHIEAEVKGGSYEEACEYAIKANLRHGKPLTKQEQQKAVRRLKELHPDWGYRKLGESINRSQNFAETVIKSSEVKDVLINTPLDDTKLEQIFPAPREHWVKIAKQAEERCWSVVGIADKVRQINLEPERADEILAVAPELKPTVGVEATVSQEQWMESSVSTRKTKADFSSLVAGDEKRDINSLKSEVHESQRQLQQDQGVALYRFGKKLAQVKAGMKRKEFKQWLEKEGLDLQSAYRVMTWAKKMAEAATQTRGDPESLAASRFRLSSFLEPETTKQLSAEEQLRQRYTWDGISNDFDNALQRAIHVAQRLSEGEFPDKAPWDDVQKLRFTLTQGRTIFDSYLEQLKNVEDIASDA